jgi:hypothetical protein
MLREETLDGIDASVDTSPKIFFNGVTHEAKTAKTAAVEDNNNSCLQEIKSDCKRKFFYWFLRSVHNEFYP